MIKGIYSAGRSLEQGIKNIDVIANNLANVNTTGYKRQIPFSEILSDSGDVGVRNITSQEQGNLVKTSNPLDLALTGKGFFVLKGDDGGTEITRDGRFKISPDGLLVSDDSMPVMGQNGIISLEDSLVENNSEIKVNKDGEIKIGDRTIATLLVVDVDNSSTLTRAGNSNFKVENQGYQVASPNEYAISQGYLEEANTNPIEEMEAMIQLNKNYESAQKVINALDQSLQQANDIGKV
jgi:flagellar basal-body rod protein FlgG